MWVEVRGGVGIAASGRGRRGRVATTLLRSMANWMGGGVAQPTRGWRTKGERVEVAEKTKPGWTNEMPWTLFDSL